MLGIAEQKYIVVVLVPNLETPRVAGYMDWIMMTFMLLLT